MKQTVSRLRRTFLRCCALLAGGAALPTASGMDAGTWSQKAYLTVFRPGPQWLPGKPLAAQPLRAHGAYMLDLYRRGSLKLAGGFADDSGGAVVFEAESDEQAQRIIAADPAVTAGVFIFQLQRWSLVDWAAAAARLQPNLR